MKTLLSLVGTTMLGFLSVVNAATIDLPVYGFEIEALEAPVGQTPVSALMTFLPVSDSFAPNINVQIQPYAGTMAEYVALSKGQFDQMKWTIVSEKMLGDDGWVAEYKGPMQGRDLHFYVRAFSRDGKVYLATGVTAETQWPTLGATIRKHVDTFKLK